MTSFGLSQPRESEADDLESALRSIEPLIPSAGSGPYVAKRLVELVTRLLRLIGRNGLGLRLESIVLQEVDADFPSIRNALVLLKNACVASGNFEKLSKNFSDADDVLASVENHFTVLDPMELGLRLEMIVNRVFGYALRVLPRPNSAVEDLVVAATGKLKALDLQQRAEVWAKVTREVAVEAETPLESGIPIDPSVVARSFFELSSSEDIPAAIARYLVDYRPRLMALATEKGQQAFPFPPLALAVVLGWKQHPISPSENERRLVQHVVNLVHLLSQRLGARVRELANALGLPDGARILAGLTEEKFPTEEQTLFRIVISECRALSAALSNFTDSMPGFEFELIRRYKLSLEFAPRENRDLLTGKNEEYCQRNLASFLIGHGAFAVGTRFGPQETDLVTGSTLDPLIIEAKLFRDGAPQPTSIQKAMVQLLEYMDKAPFKSRGALILFNLTEVPILAARELFGGRVAIVAVNLPQKTASKHDRVCVISPGNTEGLVDVILTKELRRKTKIATEK